MQFTVLEYGSTVIKSRWTVWEENSTEYITNCVYNSKCMAKSGRRFIFLKSNFSSLGICWYILLICFTVLHSDKANIFFNRLEQEVDPI